MAEDNRIYHDPEDPEHLSSEELADRIEDEKKSARRSLRLAVTALIALIAIAIAWFAANTIVSGRSSSVEAQNDVEFELASTGQRQNAENNRLKKYISGALENILHPGVNRPYKEYRETSYTEGMQANTVYTAADTISQFSEETILYTGSSNLAWYLNEQANLAPGNGGKLEFYLIPKKDGLTTANIRLNLTPYVDEGNKAVESNAEYLKALVDGHILLFASLDDKSGYTGWLEVGTNKEASFTVKAPADSTFEKNVPYKVTIRWVWPQSFSNYVYKRRSLKGDLFTENTDAEQYKTFVEAANMASGLGGRLFYNKKDSQIVTAPDGTKLDSDMPDTTADLYNDYYDQADEYIGTTAKYIYVELKVN